MCPKLKCSYYSGIYSIIREVSGKVGEVGLPVHPGFVSQLNALSLGNTTFKRDCQQICPTFAPVRDIIFTILDSKKYALCLRETLSLSFKAVCYTNILENIF